MQLSHWIPSWKWYFSLSFWKNNTQIFYHLILWNSGNLIFAVFFICFYWLFNQKIKSIYHNFVGWKQRIETEKKLKTRCIKIVSNMTQICNGRTRRILDRQPLDWDSVQRLRRNLYWLFNWVDTTSLSTFIITSFLHVGSL